MNLKIIHTKLNMHIHNQRKLASQKFDITSWNGKAKEREMCNSNNSLF